jgi:hypothetical protein
MPLLWLLLVAATKQLVQYSLVLFDGWQSGRASYAAVAVAPASFAEKSR